MKKYHDFGTVRGSAVFIYSFVPDSESKLGY